MRCTAFVGNRCATLVDRIQHYRLVISVSAFGRPWLLNVDTVLSTGLQLGSNPPLLMANPRNVCQERNKTMKYLVVSLGIVTALMTSVSQAATPADTYYWLPPKGDVRLVSKATNAAVRHVWPGDARPAAAETPHARTWVDPKGNARHLPW